MSDIILAACSASQDRVQGRLLASRGFTTTWASLSPWLEAPVVSAHYLLWGNPLPWVTVTSTMSVQYAATSRLVTPAVFWRVQIDIYFSLPTVCDDEFPFSLSFFLLPAGASVCRCPVHSEPCRERVVHQPGLRRSCGLAEGPWSPGLSEQSGPAEEPSPATAHRVTALLPTFTMSSSSLLQAPPRSSVPPSPSLCHLFSERANGRMDVGTRRGPALTGLAVSVTLLFWARGRLSRAGCFFQPTT